MATLKHDKMTGWKVSAHDPCSIEIDSYVDRFAGCSGSTGFRANTPEQAKLIAAAPEMLAALKHVLAVLESPPPNKPGGVSRTMIREAITRATA